jgi:hypothetical protein
MFSLSHPPSPFMALLTPSFFPVGAHLGLDCTGRLFVSDRAHLVFDFHQIVDGLKEVELGGSRLVFFPRSVYFLAFFLSFFLSSFLLGVFLD